MPREPVIPSPSPSDFLDNPSHAGVETDAQRVVIERNRTRVFDVRDYGTVGDGVTDDSAAIQDAIDEWKASIVDGTAGFPNPPVNSGGVLLIPHGRFRIETTLDFTSIRKRGATILCYGVLEGHTSGQPVADFTGSRWVRGRGSLMITAPDPLDAPNVGVLLAVSASQPSSGNHSFDEIDIDGAFTVACLYNYGSETNYIGRTRLWNYDTSGNARTFFFGRTNVHGVTSPYQTINTSEQSMNDVDLGFADCRVINDGPDVGQIDGVQGFCFDGYAVFGGNVPAGTKDCFIRVTCNAAAKARDIDINAHFETSTATVLGILGFDVDGGGAGGITGVHVKDYLTQAQAYLHWVTPVTPITGVRMEGLFSVVSPVSVASGSPAIRQLDLTNWAGSGSAGAIDLSALAAVTAATIRTPADSDVIRPGSWDGVVVSDTGVQIGRGLGFVNTAPISKPTVTGSRGGNAALASLLTALSDLGLITNSTSA